jgi:hypothetical protein
MKKNMGSADRIVRVILAAILAILFYNGTISGTLGIALAVFAGILLFTSLIGFCPLYLPFGLSTCKVKKQ